MSTPTGAAVVPVDGSAIEPLEARPRPAWRTVVGTIEGRIGLVLALLILVVIVIGPAIAPYTPNEIGVGIPLSKPSGDHLLGTDNLGRDVWSRFPYGGRSVLVAPLLAVALALVVGGGLGLYGAYTRGRAMLRSPGSSTCSSPCRRC